MSGNMGQILIQIFLSTPSARRATEGKWDAYKIKAISIHALREEGDIYKRDTVSFCK